MTSRRESLLDADLESAARELLAHDERAHGLEVKVRFDGAVAHVEGDVACRDDLARLRELLTRLAGVRAVWDRVRVAGAEPRVVDIGCGDTLQYPTNVGIDRCAADGVDVVADLARGLPLADASAEAIFAVHVLEHLADYLPVVDECHRVLRPGGVLHVMAPHWRHVNAVADPTHLRYFDTQTFKHFCTPGRAGRLWYPLIVSTDGASVLADLVPVKAGQEVADEVRLARFFT